MTRAILLVLGAPLFANAFVMMFAPDIWYSGFPGVAERGALNHHFIRDLGCAFLVASGSFVLGAWRPSRMRSAIVAGSCLLSLHAGVHIVEVVSGAHELSRVAIVADVMLVYSPTALAIVAAWLVCRENRNGEPGTIA